MGSIAKISGVALRPGVSRNQRLYTAEQIAKAAARMQERLADPNGLPIPMRTHHDAGDETDRIVGRITEVSVDNDKALRYKAELYDTKHGRDIASLATAKSPALRSVSIHGYWLGDVKKVSTESGSATTADDLEIDAIDFTAFPGVVGALIDPSADASESMGGRTPISESMEVSLVLEEPSGWADIEEAKYSADDMKALLAKGHAMKNTNGEPSYPIADKADLAKAIKAVGRGKADHDAIRKHIIKRAAALGASDMIPDDWNTDGSMKENEVRLGEITEYYPDGPSNPSGFCIDAYSGPLSVTVRGCVPPDQLRDAAQAAMCAAMDVMTCMDPDEDADIDAGDPDDMDGMSGESRVVNINVEGGILTEKDLRQVIQDQMSLLATRYGLKEPEVASEAALPPDDHSHTHDTSGDATHTHAHDHDHAGADGATDYSHSHTHAHVHDSTDGPEHEHGHNHIHMTSPSASAESDTNQEESAVSETTPAAEAAPTRTLSDADLSALGETIGTSIGQQLAEALRAMAEQTAPKHAAPAPQETAEPVAPIEAVESTTKTDIDVAALKESLAKELRKEIRDELRQDLLEEKGLPRRRGYRVSETDDEERQLTDAELFDQHRTDILLGNYAMTPAPAQA